ncbi:valacyclovir hydrolase [Drosophila guanche]|uniref:Blast:Valacyclovir hydrolase n=1 Tax=Drosophila guanche TaxID=7266 RepID=A0A3B0K1I5_DROGU|nr:valacyclovir hydrolase [Drosophila guanche]SPP88127.1 blast:Valacyclovir hydrolase [Drosophila guanche]
MLSRLGRLAPRLCRAAHTERKVNVQGIDLHIVECGSGPRSLLLMPGALGSAWTDFKPQIEQLPKLLPEHTIIAWDPPGYGKSVPPQRRFGLEFFQKDAQAAVDLMRALDRPKFSILGWSDGGITALIVAGRHAEAVERLAIWGAGAYLNEEEVKSLRNIRDVAKWSPRMREPMEKVYGVERFAQLWAEWVDAACSFYDQRDGDFCRSEVEQVKAPTFILHGKKDPMIAVEHVPWLKKRLPQAEYYEFPEGKHNIHLRYADEFNKLVAEFFNKKA